VELGTKRVSIVLLRKRNVKMKEKRQGRRGVENSAQNNNKNEKFRRGMGCGWV
jgi:hypothetical protein